MEFLRRGVKKDHFATEILSGSKSEFGRIRFSVCGDLRRLSKFLRCFDEVGGIYGSASRRPKQQGTENHPERNGRHSVSGFQLIPADSVIVHGAISRL